MLHLLYETIKSSEQNRKKDELAIQLEVSQLQDVYTSVKGTSDALKKTYDNFAADLLRIESEVKGVSMSIDVLKQGKVDKRDFVEERRSLHNIRESYQVLLPKTMEITSQIEHVKRQVIEIRKAFLIERMYDFSSAFFS